MSAENFTVVDQPPEPLGVDVDVQAIGARMVIERAQARVAAASDGVDEGYFPEGSVLRQVQSNRVVGLFYGQVGLTIGGTDPLNYIGTSEHTRDRELPFRRLAETAEAFETIFFGSREQADHVINRVALMHTQVQGETTQAVGPYPKGSAYAAHDPDRGLWTVGCMAYPAVSLYEKLVRPLSDEQRESFWQDYRLLGELFGLSRDDTPATYPEFQNYMHERLASDELHLSKAAKYMGEQVCFHTPIPRLPKPARHLMNVVMRGMLPPEVRDMYEVSYGPLQAGVFQAGVLAIRLGTKLLPDGVTMGENAVFFEWVKEEETRLQALGRQAVMPADPYSLTKPIGNSGT